MATLLLCYHSTALWTSKGGPYSTWASTICRLWSFLVHYYIARPSQSFLAASVAFRIAFIFLCSLSLATCSQPTTRRYCEHEHTLLWPLTFLQVYSDHRCCGQGSPVANLRIIVNLMICRSFIDRLFHLYCPFSDDIYTIFYLPVQT